MYTTNSAHPRRLRNGRHPARVWLHRHRNFPGGLGTSFKVDATGRKPSELIPHRHCGITIFSMTDVFILYYGSSSGHPILWTESIAKLSNQSGEKDLSLSPEGAPFGWQRFGGYLDNVAFLDPFMEHG